MMVKTGKIKINQKEADYIDKALDHRIMDEDDIIAHTAVFDDGMQMDVKCCGSQAEPAWTEAVLFDMFGIELNCSEPAEDYLGVWELEYRGTLYRVNVYAE